MKGIVAAVDIGTNSVKLVVSDGQSVLADETLVTRLGAGVDSAGRLDPEAKARTLAALGQLATRARALGAVQIAAVGTSALRDASDGPEFAARAAAALGGPVEIISGEKEAQLTYLAARLDPDLALPEAAALVTSDIGGGSSEVVIGEWAVSLQMGAVRLTERTQPSDPWSAADLARASALAREALPAPVEATSERVFVASGGTAANLAGIALAERGEPVSVHTIHGVRLTRQAIEERAKSLAALPLVERRSVAGLESARADVIIAGALLQAALLVWAGTDELIVNARGLRYGLLYALLGR